MTGRQLLAGAVRAGLVLALAAGLALPIGMARSPAGAGGAPLRSGAFEPARPAPDFALPAAAGGAFELRRQRGNVVVLTFGYSSCPDVCPTVLAELAQVRARLGGAARRLRVVYISVDPERDTPARLRAFTEQFDRTFIGLTGPADQLAAVWKAYGVQVARRDAPGGNPPTYAVHHSASVFLIDAAGRLRVMAPFGTPLDDVRHDIGVLLKE